MILQAAAYEGLTLVWFLLAAASAGVFLHAGIKFPWFVFFQRDSGLRPKDAPWNMAAAMLLFAFLCVLLGVAPDLLYRFLPYPVEYQAYTAGKVVFYLQLLMFSGLAFFLLLPLMRRTETITLNVRVISASNRDLARMVEEGSFRQDLFYRLVVFPITLPPLRDRREDIPLLVEHFLEKYARDAGKKMTRVESKAMEALASHGWPGNVRELENVIHRTLLVSAGLELRLDDLPSNIIAAGESSPSPRTPVTTSTADSPRSLEDLEREAIISAMESNSGNLSDVARQLGIGRSTLYRKLEQYGLRDKK